MEPSPQLLEILTSKQYGEKGHIEYGWSNDIREKILQLSFQFVRTTEENMCKLERIYYELLYDLTIKYKFDDSVSKLEKDIAFHYLKILYKMIGQIRDIVEGNGEYFLSYRMIYTWYFISPELACLALKSFVISEPQTNYKDKPYGSWKDIKYFCNFCISRGLPNEHLLITYSVKLINEQLRMDNSNKNNNKNISLVAKWIPREKSRKFGWMFKLLAMDYFPEYIETATCSEKMNKAINKCKMEYRTIISYLNKLLNTTEIKQCNQEWSTIDFSLVPSVTIFKNNAAFLNTKNKMSEDRMKTAENFRNFIQENKTNEIKGTNIDLKEFTKKAFQLLEMESKNDFTKNENILNKVQVQMDLLNSQWRSNSLKNESLGNIISMVDISENMFNNSYAGIGLAIRIAEKSALGKRIVTFSNYPRWINLESEVNFTDMIKKIKHSSQTEIGTNANFYSALEMILDTIIEVKMTPEYVQDLMLVIFSDMQFDFQKEKDENNNLNSNIKKKYEETGVKMYGKPFKPPHILFWNLNCNNGFPALSNQSNCSMLSGYNPNFLNIFSKSEEKSSLTSSSPWSIFLKSLQNKRYQLLEKRFIEIFLL
jgi:hypothetical protein